MKALSIKQPWAWLIVDSIKDIENRTWVTKFRGRVLVHATTPRFDNWYDTPLTNDQILTLPHIYPFPTVFGAIIGSVEIVDCVINHTSIWAEKSVYHGEVVEKVNGECEIIKPIYNWVLANPIIFPEPIPAKGKLSFWDYPNILSEPEEKGGPLYCHCQLPVKEFYQVMTGVNNFMCRYCGGIWYK